MRHRAATCLRTLTSSGVLLLCSAYVHAQSAETDLGKPPLQPAYDKPLVTQLEIERAAGSESCPDVNAVLGAVARLFPDRTIRRAVALEPSNASVHVQIRPAFSGHEALVKVYLPRTGERVLIENDVTCSGLAEALAVTLVMLIEPSERKLDATTSPLPAENATNVPSEVGKKRAASAVSTQKNEKPTPIATPKPQEMTPLSSVARPSKNKSFAALVAASGAGGFGLLSKPAIGGLVGVDFFDRSGWGLSLSGLRLWAIPAEAHGGSVTLTLWGGIGGPCYRQRFLATADLEACLLVGFGKQHAVVENFENMAPKSVSWAVFGPRLRGVAQLAESIAAVAGIGAVGQIHPQSFSVTKTDAPEERLTVAEAPRVGLLVEIGLRVGGEFL